MVVRLDHGLPDRLGEEGDGPGSTMQVRGAQDRGAKPGRLLFLRLVPLELEAGRAASTCVHVQPPAWLPVQWSKRTAPEGGRAVTAVGPAPEAPGTDASGRAGSAFQASSQRLATLLVYRPDSKVEYSSSEDLDN
ncbi:unnamed protein product [Rangifer tarandus platyrhynchus]|uniref:Uncharacterized protein n=1 Tax=Rangifer tarandus platyrhynchus TaxID=3082113 RepID=A0ABN8YKS1_RANTA|nr:unnamed protein product [Rangifer tarandus platyrhynchus]